MLTSYPCKNTQWVPTTSTVILQHHRFLRLEWNIHAASTLANIQKSNKPLNVCKYWAKCKEKHKHSISAGESSVQAAGESAAFLGILGKTRNKSYICRPKMWWIDNDWYFDAKKYWWLNFMSQKIYGHWQLNFYSLIILVIDNRSYDTPKILLIHKWCPKNIGDWQQIL